MKNIKTSQQKPVQKMGFQLLFKRDPRIHGPQAQRRGVPQSGSHFTKALSPLVYNQPADPDHMTSGTCWGHKTAKGL